MILAQCLVYQAYPAQVMPTTWPYALGRNVLSHISASINRQIGDARPEGAHGNRRQVRRLPFWRDANLNAGGGMSQQFDERPPGQAPRAKTPCIHERIEAQAAMTPEAMAVTCDGVSLTYLELNRRANQVAHRLRTMGVGPDTLVAIGMDRSIEMVISLFGILKAGGAYLPLDTMYPKERVQFMLEDARPAVLLTSEAHQATLPAVGVPTLLVDPTWSAFQSDPDDDPEHIVSPEDLAYVIYTSGSTGKPKGCQVTHSNVARLFTSTEAWFHFGPQDVWTFFHSHAFDFSVWEIWGALIHGGRVVVVPYLTSRSPEQFLRLLVSEGVTVLNQTPSAFKALIHADLVAGIDPTDFALRYVIFGGEALELQMLRPWLERHGDQRPQLVNMYGITETTVHVTYRPLTLGDVERNAGSLIGQPIPDLRLYLLDANLDPVPMGDVGEIHVAGAGVCRGYLNRPELTAERFFEWQSPEGSTLRLYKTGDLARRLPDGDIAYLGRSDQQVKIRGFRIETGEIESVLSGHESVRACAVVARSEDGQPEARLVAYVVPAGGQVSPSELRRHLSESLPEYMVPAAFVELPELPLTENGKLDRRALPSPPRQRPEIATTYEPPSGALESTLCGCFGEMLAIDSVGRNDNFFELGGDSLLATRLLLRLRELPGPASGRTIATSVLFRNPTPAKLAAYVEEGETHDIPASRFVTRHGKDSTLQDPIAIVAMAGRFPGASDVEAFWRNLCEGVESITYFSPEDLDASVTDQQRADPAYVKARGIIDGVEWFDAAFFGIGPREAELMDPQQRLLLELAWECIERAGYVPDAMPRPVGVFAGMFNATYFQHHVAARPDLIDKVGTFQVMLDNEKDFIATRVAYKLNLTGPAISVHTACSTSLVAICQAMDSLRLGQCDAALAGGVAITCPPRSGYVYQEGAMLSPDGHTRTFDADAQGTVFSDGAALVMLKRLPDAIADGDQVYAVIRGGAVNNDGAGKASFTAPSSDGQAAVIAMAHERAQVDPRSISYVETHGTATPVGDPIEIEGLTRAFRRETDATGFCRIGSVKSNVGHLVIAAGATGVIKTALSLHEQRIPATLHFHAPNPTIDFSASPFVVNAATVEWPQGEHPRRAGVSSFGVGGTNAHIILEEAPCLPQSDQGMGPQLLVLSARSPNALSLAANRLADHLEKEGAVNLADVAWTLSVGRKAFPHRLAIVAGDAPDAVTQLRSPALAAVAARSRPARPRDVVLLFPGQGATYPGMGRALYASEPAFRAAFDECIEALGPSAGQGLRDRMSSDDPEAMRPTAIMQPATFIIEYALARLWLAGGITPVAMIGHSVGEFVAATLSGVFKLTDAIRLISMRGELMQALPEGGMLSARMSLADLLPILPSELSLAAENGPASCVVSGPHEAIAAFQATLDQKGVACRTLRTSHAFHSHMMDPAVIPFRNEVAKLELSAPRVPIVSTASGDWLPEDAALSPDYWASHLREPVRFSSAIGRVVEDGRRILLEAGPRATLCTLARQHPTCQKHDVSALASLGESPDTEEAMVRLATGQLWVHGVPIDPALFDRRIVRHRVRLPTYPFDRQRYWVEAAKTAVRTPVSQASATAELSPNGGQSEDVDAQSTRLDLVDPRAALKERIRQVIEDTAGFHVADTDADENFIALGMDSLMLTQLALQLQRVFPMKISFRDLMTELSSLDRLARQLEASLPDETSVADQGDSTNTVKQLHVVASARQSVPRLEMDDAHPIVPGARLGREPDGRPAWFVADPQRAGKFLKVGT